LFENFLVKLNTQNLEKHVSSLKAIQSIRSAGVAHRKGSEYEKVISKLRLNTNDFQAEFDRILSNTVYLLKEIPIDNPN
jgi:hypothetical protein